MFGNFFKKNKNKKEPVASTPKSRDLFAELFPLTEDNKSKFDTTLNSILTKMFGEEGHQKLTTYSRNYADNEIQLGRLILDDMNWNQLNKTEHSLEYQSDNGDVMVVDILSPNGQIEKGQSQLQIYRNWIRERAVQEKGGLILCEYLNTKNGLEGYESITKNPREGTTGMDYIYFLNINNYEEQKLYQIKVKIFEMNPTGLRDNMAMHPICEIANIDMGELMGLYRQDPYQTTFKEGNVMNISERAEFDAYFPFHPLSIIRREIRPNMKKKLRFD